MTYFCDQIAEYRPGKYVVWNIHNDKERRNLAKISHTKIKVGLQCVYHVLYRQGVNFCKIFL